MKKLTTFFYIKKIQLLWYSPSFLSIVSLFYDCEADGCDSSPPLASIFPRQLFLYSIRPLLVCPSPLQPSSPSSSLHIHPRHSVSYLYLVSNNKAHTLHICLLHFIRLPLFRSGQVRSEVFVCSVFSTSLWYQVTSECEVERSILERLIKIGRATLENSHWHYFFQRQL